MFTRRCARVVQESAIMATPKCAANYAPLTPILFLERSASVYPERTSIIYGDLRFTWKQTMERCRCLASKVAQLVSAGQTVTDPLTSLLPLADVSLSIDLCANFDGVP